MRKEAGKDILTALPVCSHQRPPREDDVFLDQPVTMNMKNELMTS